MLTWGVRSGGGRSHFERDFASLSHPEFGFDFRITLP